VRVKNLHSWDVSPSEAIELQKKLAKRVKKKCAIKKVEYIAGMDIATGRNRQQATAAVVVLKYPEMGKMAVAVERGDLTLPYIPGLLSFREAPLLMKVAEKLVIKPDLIMVDGQGIAHPRRIGLASHIGLLLEIPTIGCAKSLLCGKYEQPDDEPGSYSDIVDSGEVIGVALRTRKKVKPVFVSIGNMIGLEEAVSWTLNTCRGYRLPEPVRLAHIEAGEIGM
jgi:deoxyribonuclease V